MDQLSWCHGNPTQSAKWSEGNCGEVLIIVFIGLFVTGGGYPGGPSGAGSPPGSGCPNPFHPCRLLPRLPRLHPRPPPGGRRIPRPLAGHLSPGDARPPTHPHAGGSGRALAGSHPPASRFCPSPPPATRAPPLCSASGGRKHQPRKPGHWSGPVRLPRGPRGSRSGWRDRRPWLRRR